MKRKNQGMKKAGTHFEQIPLAVVKKIAEGGMFRHEEAGSDGESTRRAPGRPQLHSVPARAPRGKRP
jgi:hypothetical protein